MILQNIWTKVVGNVLTNFPPAIVFSNLTFNRNIESTLTYSHESTAHRSGQLGLTQ